MPALLSLVLMGTIAYAFWKEGIFNAICMFVNVFLAGLVAFNFYEPFAQMLEPMLKGMLDGYEDAISLVALFCGTVALLRSAVNYLVNNDLAYPQIVYQFGAGFFGLATGYLVAGFLFCALQTLPWHENFLAFDVKMDPADPGAGMRKTLPPDRVWLALMHRASKVAFAQSPPEVFDKDGSFEWRYARYRRYNDYREAMPYSQELEKVPALSEPAPQQ